MNDDNWNDGIDNDFEEYITELDTYEAEVDNKIWINELISGIDLD